MFNNSHKLLMLLSALVLFASCKKNFDEFYERPKSLEAPIYQQLESKGNFKNLLACIDKAGYKKALSGAGYWTFFAPTDSAFQSYFRDRNISSVEQLDSNACQRIVTYSLVYNAFKKDRLGDYQSNNGWVPNNGFRRRTASYKGVYETKDTSGNTIKVINSNRNNNGTFFFAEADNNNKYLTYFVDNFMSAKGITAFDYNYFYPSTSYTGFNVLDAVVTEKDIAAENGVIHVINKVITALPDIDEYLASNQQYSEFKKLFDKYLVQYVLNAAVTQNYQNLNGGGAGVYTKVYNPALAFSLNNENFMRLQDNDAQSNTYTLFAPVNNALRSYIDTVLLQHYSSLDAVPRNIIYDFVNAHMWQTAVWPTKFSSSFSILGEEARFNPATNVVDKKVLSNGLFYGTNKVQEANVFSSVYGKAYLDPQYSMMTSLLNQELKFQISNINQKYTLFLIPNTAFNAAGYFSDPLVDNNPNFQWRYTPPGGGAAVIGSSALVRLLRILNLHVVPGVDLQNITGTGVAMTNGGEFIGFGNNTVYAAGNVDAANAANVVQTKTAKNGTVYYLNRVLNYSELNIGKHIERIGVATTSEFNFFWQYLRNANIYNFGTGEIINVASGSFYTLFIPNNASIRAAVNAGLLPGTGVAPNKVPNFNPGSLAEKELVNKFIYYHILNKKTVATNGQESGSFETLLKKVSGDPTTIFVNNTSANNMLLTDMTNRSANVLLPGSNYLSNRAVIHLINNYLKYIE